MALKLFASDHDGKYPGQGVPVEMTKAPTTSNAAFACLFPTYVTSETIFGNRLSAYQTRQPDNVYDHSYTGTPVKTLEAGENVYAYISGLTDSSDPRSPQVVDGPDGTLFYNSTPTKRGGVWGGKGAVVIRLDNSGQMEKTHWPRGQALYPRRHPRTPAQPARSFLVGPRCSPAQPGGRALSIEASLNLGS